MSFRRRAAYSVCVNKTAIATLVRRAETLVDLMPLVERTVALREHCDLRDVDLLVFYERGTVRKPLRAAVDTAVGLPLRWTEVYPFLPSPSVVEPVPDCFGWGYRHMCQFWFCTFWDYVLEYDVLVRVDDDCVTRSDLLRALTAPLSDELLVTYGMWFPDTAWVTVGMTDFFNARCAVQRAERPCTCGLEPGRCTCTGVAGPATQVMAANLAGLRREPATRRLVDAVLASGRCLSHRWGDAPLWGELLTRELPTRHRLVGGVQYVHRSWDNWEVSS